MRAVVFLGRLWDTRAAKHHDGALDARFVHQQLRFEQFKLQVARGAGSSRQQENPRPQMQADTLARGSGACQGR